MKSKHLSFILSLLLLFCLTSSLVYSQRLTGILRGTVTDDQGEILPGVTVEIESPALIGGKKSTVTTASGAFIFASLSPGSYTATFILTGFQGVKREKIIVSVGKTTTLDVAMKQAGIEETVNVIGAAPVVDVTKSGTSTTYDQQLMENLPKTRFTYIDIMAWSPGVSMQETGGEEWHSSFGSSYWSDNYLVDGVDTSFDLNGTTWVWNNPDIYQEGEVVAIGAPAEYGDFQGAVVNVVTKSGGNSWHAELNTYVIPTSFVGNNTSGVDFPSDVTQYPYNIKVSRDLSFDFSGPIKKDKLWFYSNFQYKRYSYSQLGTPPDTPTEAAYDRGFVKFTWQLAKNHKLVASYQHEVSDLPDVISVAQPYDACPKEPGYYGVPNLMLTSILGPNTILDLKLGGWGVHDEWVPMDGNLDESAHVELSNGYYTKGIWGWSKTTYIKVQASAAVSHYADDFIQGNHEFKAGVQYTRFSTDGIYSYSGGAVYYDYYGLPYYAYFQNPYNYFLAVNKVAGFFDDAWAITNRLTVNLGLRFDHQDADIGDVEELDAHRNPTGKTISGLNNVISWNTFSPRLGLVYQLTSDRKTILRASYGHYYDGLMTNQFGRLNPSAPNTYAYQWNTDTGKYDIPLWVLDHTSGYRVGDAKNSLCKQFSLGITRELIRDVSLELTFVYKDTNNFLSWWNSTGQYEAAFYPDEYAGKTITVYNQINDPSENVFVLQNVPEYKQRFKGLVVALQKRLTNNWQLSSSFVVSKAYGVATGTQIRQGGFSGLQSPNDLVNNNNWDGLLQSDRTYMFKLQGTYFLPYDFSISANFQALSGKPIARTLRVYGMNQGPVTVLAEPRGSEHRLDSAYGLDFRVEKKLNFTNRFGVKIAADFFNLLNAHTMIDTLSTIGTAEGFMKPSVIIPPRRIQLAIRVFY